MGLFDSIGDAFDSLFGGGSGSSPTMNYHTEDPTGTPGAGGFDWNFNAPPTMTQHSEDPTGTPGASGFDWSSFANSLNGGSNSAASSPIFNFGAGGGDSAVGGSGGYMPFATSGGAGSPLSTTSASSNTPYNSTVATEAAAAAPGAPGAAPGGKEAPGTMAQIMSALGLDQATGGGIARAGIAGGGLLYNLLSGSPSSEAQKQLKNIAQQQNSQGQLLQSYISNGTLPPGAQQWVTQQSNAQKAAIRSKYAQMGMSGSTSEVQELNQVDQQATSQMFTLATQLLNTGVQETGASGNLYNYLIQQQNADQKEVGDAIQNFVASLGGGGSGGNKGGKQITIGY